MDGEDSIIRGIMMGLFKSKYQKELETLAARIDINMSNNYKDNAQENLKELEARFDELKKEGLLKDKEISLFEEKIATYKEKMKGYTHKDQKPYWT